MSSSDNNYVDISPGEASSEDVLPASRRRSRTRTPHGPRKKRRLGSVDPSQIRQYELEGKYNDGYRQLFNEHVTAGQFQDEPVHYSKQVGTSAWSSTEQAAFFAALGRLGKDSLPGIAGAIGTKSESEVRDFLLLLQDAAARQANAKVTLRDIPAAVEVGSGCDLHMDEAAEALAWYQERLEATQEKERYAEYWLITPRIADDIESAVNPGVPSRAGSPTTASEPETSYRGVAGYVLMHPYHLC
jgi:RNA polymerase I-specific transcription initiation factor RRN5